ncbi:hypothetical protein ABZ863_04580 [Saccharomonospora sp. NPDC046836]
MKVPPPTHHRLKDRPGWTYRLHPDTGVVTVTTPSGYTYTSNPEPPLTG